jgi:type II secretory pathway pseudopilin PulG
MVVALTLLAIIVAALLPGFRAIQNSWDSKTGTNEVLQNGRVLMDHLYRNISKAASITAVSNFGVTTGYIEFKDDDGNVLRYDIGASGYVEFGPAGSLSDLAGPVSQLQFTCYNAVDLDNPIDISADGVDGIRSVKIQATLSNTSGLGQDETLTTQIYLRANTNTDDIDLVGWWKLDETSGSTACDSSGNGNNGTLYNMSSSDWVTGKVGGALDFDGWNDYVRVPDNPTFDIADEITVMAWIKPEDTDYWSTIVSKLAHTPWCRLDLYWFLNNDKIGASLAGPCPYWYYWMPNVGISTNVWTHVALTYDGSAMKMYKNGVCAATLVASGALMLANSSSNEPLYIGKNTEWGENYEGEMDDIRIYSRALNADEIAAIWSEGSLVGYWKLDDGSGNHANDSSGNGNDGDLIHMEPGQDWVTGHVGGALNFNGSDEYVRVDHDQTFNIANRITLVAWINPDNASTWRTIVSKFAYVPYCRKDLYWFLNNYKIGAFLAGPCTSDWTPNVSISTGIWTHVALVYDGSAMKMYKNGVSSATIAASGSLMLAQSSSDEDFFLGRNDEWGSYFDGKLDDLRIYGWSLIDAQIGALYSGQELVWPEISQILP